MLYRSGALAESDFAIAPGFGDALGKREDIGLARSPPQARPCCPERTTVSFIAQRDDRVDFCCAAGGDVASQNSGSRQNQGDAAEDERIVSADSEEEAGKDTRSRESNQRAQD